VESLKQYHTNHRILGVNCPDLLSVCAKEKKALFIKTISVRKRKKSPFHQDDQCLQKKKALFIKMISVRRRKKALFIKMISVRRRKKALFIKMISVRKRKKHFSSR
jgi:hypothetical protein